jgi:two-component system NarL family response regulator
MKSKLDSPIRLLLVNEVRLMGDVIVAALEDQPDIQVIACVTTTDEALQVVRERNVDVVLVSTSLPSHGGLYLISAITKTSPATKVLALGLTEEKKRVLRYVEAGASGYILQDHSLADLVEIVRATQEGRVFVSPHIAAAMMERLTDLAQMFTGIEMNMTDTTSLTSREVEVLELISRRFTNQQIAHQLVIEVGTVKNHVHSILEKLNVSSRGEAAAYLAFISR